MSKRAVNLKVKIDDLAEGSLSKMEHLEPFDPFKTSAMPRLIIAPDAPTSDTGINAIVDSNAEAAGADDTQDGAVTSGESVPVSAHAVAISASDKQADVSYNKPVLIVEDTVELAEVVQATLENMGLEVITAVHGEIGLDKYRASKPEIILLDIGLPDMTGWKFLDAIKEMKAKNQIAEMPIIIIITAYDDAANRLVGKLQGIHSYLVKPFTPDFVEQLVTMAINGEKPSTPDFGTYPPSLR
jgi:CheY-like chemotaxis protein